MSRQLLILDLDETLIHAVEQPLNRREDFIVGPYYVYRRPHVDAFIREVNRHFDLAVWTSSTAGYADLVVEALFPESVELKFVWDRKRCVTVENLETQTRHWVKDLKKVKRLGYPLDRILVIDDTPQKLARHESNLIPVLPFEGSSDDEELLHMLRYLPTLLWAVDVRRRKLLNWRTEVQVVTQAGS